MKSEYFAELCENSGSLRVKAFSAGRLTVKIAKSGFAALDEKVTCRWQQLQKLVIKGFVCTVLCQALGCQTGH